MSGAVVAGHNTSGKLLRLFGRMRNDAAMDEPDAAAPGEASHSSETGGPGKQARRELLAEITDFLLDNDLDISPGNLLAAHAAFSGADPGLGRRIAARQIAGEKVSQEWLNSVIAEISTEDDQKAELDRLFSRLENSIESFTHTARTARSAAADYNSELEQHVAVTEEPEAAQAQMISRLADLAKAMLDRTRRVEEEMKRSEREAATLRRSLAKAKRDAAIDHLTGLPNRRAFEYLLETHYHEAKREFEPLSVAFCDIDHFKRINDTHGHDTGDRVIQAIAQALARISNDNCHVARHGGEEFVMLFRGKDKREAQLKLDETREFMAQRQFVNRITDEPIGQITFSGGVADVFAYPDARTALRAADEALYRAKQTGRNRIELA